MSENLTEDGAAEATMPSVTTAGSILENTDKEAVEKPVRRRRGRRRGRRRTRRKVQRPAAARKKSRKMVSTENLRMTSQRRAVISALKDFPGHPTVKELYDAAKLRLPGISLATIYNSVQALQRSGMVIMVREGGGGARYCINKRPQVHMMDENTGRIIDVSMKEGLRPEDVFDLPEGAEVASMRAYLLGKLPS